MTTKQVSSISLAETARAMNELIGVGKPNGKLAFWNACLSTRNKLERNCMQAQVMRRYVDSPLPINRQALHVELGGLLSRTLNTLYEIEKLWNVGIIHFNCGSTFEEQATWRLSMVAIIPGMGMKTVSFALHIYAPKECLLLTVDIWHQRVLDHAYGDVSPANYTRYESDLYRKVNAMAQETPGYPPLVYAACLWERKRQENGAGNKDGSYQSHACLSCYI